MTSLHRSGNPPLVRWALTVFGLLAAASCTFGQAPTDSTAPSSNASLLSAPTKPIEFDVATFKLNKSGEPTPKLTTPVGGDGFSMRNRPFHDLIRYAFAKGHGGAYRISGQPAWVDNDRYDIQAKVAPEDLAEWKRLNLAGQKTVLQSFLVEYLKLKQHPDPTPYPYYALVVAKGGIKMKEYKPGDSFKTADGRTITSPDSGTLEWITGNEVIGLNCTMERLSDMFSGHADRVVHDQTGLDGAYNFTLEFDPTPDPNHPDSPGTPFLDLHPGDTIPTVRSAVKQLGLELKSATGPTDGMVIDHIEPPSEN
jgi:uncharacterized protein (TIGR03435 family)